MASSWRTCDVRFGVRSFARNRRGRSPRRRRALRPGTQFSLATAMHFLVVVQPFTHPGPYAPSVPGSARKISILQPCERSRTYLFSHYLGFCFKQTARPILKGAGGMGQIQLVGRVRNRRVFVTGSGPLNICNEEIHDGWFCVASVRLLRPPPARALGTRKDDVPLCRGAELCVSGGEDSFARWSAYS